MMVAIAVPLAFQFPLNQLWNAQTYRISPHVAAANAAMARVPDGASVLTTLDLLAPLAARTDTYWIGNGGNPRAQYIVFDGQDSDYSPAISNVPAYIAGLYPPAPTPRSTPPATSTSSASPADGAPLILGLGLSAGGSGYAGLRVAWLARASVLKSSQRTPLSVSSSDCAVEGSIHQIWPGGTATG